MTGIERHEGSIELVLVADQGARIARFELAPDGIGWCLASETGTDDDGTSRRVRAHARDPLWQELERVLVTMLGRGYTVERCRLLPLPPCA